MTMRTVLIVDDDQRYAEELADLLDAGGYRAVTCNAAGLAPAAVQKEHPDVILLDINLGGVDGYQLAEALRKDRQLATVPIIAMSAYFERRPYEMIGAHYGIKDFLAKPFHPLDIIARIESALSGATKP